MVQKKVRIEYITLSRALAIILITLLHALTRSFRVHSGTQTEFYSIPLYMTIIKAGIYGVSRIGLCIFLMITGALMLPRNYSKTEEIKRFFTHNWLTLFITTEIWYVIMFWFKQTAPGSILLEHGLKSCLLSFLSTICFINPVTMETMWYMPVILCAYLMIPVFAVALKHIPNKYLILPCGIVIIGSFVIPILNGILVGTGSPVYLEFKFDSAHLFSMYMIYILAGYFINDGYLDRIKSRYLIIIGCFFIALFCGLQMWMWSTEFEYLFGQYEKDIFLLISSVCLFALLKRIPISSAVAKISEKLAEISFGIYFIHICILACLSVIMKRYLPQITYLNKFVILETVSFFGSILIIQLLRKNKILAKYLLGIRNNS